jgi:two-component sensor histidine kinase
MPGARTRLLYVDDDPGVGRLVQRYLERLGRQVVLAADGEAGLALARAERFDAIALDHYMPGRDGLDVLADLRALPDPAPVVFVTAAEEPRIAVAALKAGASDYVVKDLQGAYLDLLDRAVEQAVQETALRRERDRAELALRESRDRLEALAARQSLLLREVNHRVANSLQLISSLLEMQARRTDDTDARDALHAAAERVEAVSLVHRRLYTSDDVSHVEMDQYLAGLVEELQRSVGAEAAPCSIRLSADPVRVETDKAVAIGLVVNELVTNAAKYAYPGGDGGEVRVEFRRRDGDLTLIVEDDGVGMPPGGAKPQGSGLGTIIVAAMARTARATVETRAACTTIDAAQAKPGTRVTLRLAAA